MNNTYHSERYQEMKRLGINMEAEHIPVPSDHAPRKEMVQQTEDSLWMWEKDNLETEYLYEGPIAEVKR